MRARLLCCALLLAGCGESTEPEADDPALQARDDAGPGSDAAAPDPEPDAAPPATGCEGATELLYDPLAGDRLYAFPDDYYTEPAETATGLRPKLDEAIAPWLADERTVFRKLYDALPALDGWGTAAAVSLRFSGPLAPFSEGADGLTGGLALYDLGADPPARIPFEIKVFEEGKRIFLWPLVPLRPATEHAVVVTGELRDAAGDCIRPSATQKALLSGEAVDARLSALAPRHAALPARLGLRPDALSGAVLFTTQTLADESLAVAAEIAGRQVEWAAPPRCRPYRRDVRVCEGDMTATDYRRDGLYAGGEAVAEYAIPVSVWIPTEGEGPWPLVIVGHGLGGDRSLGGVLAEVMGGHAVFAAIDAIGHGEHPTRTSNSPISLLTDFFEVDIGRKTIDVLRLRDNWRQSSWDKLQLLALLRGAPDLDGDGAPELDLARVGYFGASLGGLMGPEFIATADGLGAAALAMPGGRISTTVAESGSFAQLLRTMVPSDATEDEVEHMLAVLQVGMERGDPVNYGPHLVRDRLPGADSVVPNLLMQVAIGDEVVPNSSSDALSRAIRVPQVPPVLVEVPLLDHLRRAPVRGNLDGATVGLFQYDVVVPYGGGDPTPADHNNLVGGRHTIHQLLQFFRTWKTEGTATIVDPFAELGRPRR